MSFGKDRSQSDLRLALEPYKPESGYSPQEVEENKRRTFGLISRLHLKVYREKGAIFKILAPQMEPNNGRSITPLQSTPFPTWRWNALRLTSQVLQTKPEAFTRSIIIPKGI